MVSAGASLAGSLFSLYSAHQEAKERERIAREEAEAREQERLRAEAEARERERQEARERAAKARNELVRQNFSNDTEEQDRESDERAEARRKLYLEQVEQDDKAAIVASKIDGFYKQGLAQLQEYVRDQEAALVGSPEKAAETALRAFQDYAATTTSPKEALVSEASELILDALKTEPEKKGGEGPAIGRTGSEDMTIGDVVKDQVAHTVASSLLDAWSSKLDALIQPKSQSPDVEPDTQAAYDDLWRQANPMNLGKGVREYMNTVVDKFDTFFGLATRDITGTGSRP